MVEIVIKGTAKEMADLLREVTSLPDEKKNSNISSHMHCASIWHDPDFRSKFPNGAPISDGSEGTLIGRVPGKMRIEIDNIDDSSKPEIRTESSEKKGKLRVVIENVDTSSIPTYRETAVDE